MQFRLPIGDWSDDGHGKCEWFMAESDKTMKEINEAHSKMKKVLGFTISDFCNEYEESFIPKKYLVKIEKIGFDLESKMGEPEDDGSRDIDPRGLAELWVFMLNKIDPTLNIVLTPEATIPELIGEGAGYGLFD